MFGSDMSDQKLAKLLWECFIFYIVHKVLFYENLVSLFVI